MINNKLLKQCLEILKSDDIRNEIKIILSPFTDLILHEIYPYIYCIMGLVFFIFIILLTILIIIIKTHRTVLCVV